MKRILPFFLLLLASVLMVGCCKTTEPGAYAQERLDACMARLADKHGLDVDKLAVVEFTPRHKGWKQMGVWFDMVEIVLPDFGKFKYGDKTITVYSDKDDFYYDELVQAVSDHFSALLGVDRVVVDLNGALGEDEKVSSVYAGFLRDNDVSAVDGSTVQELLAQAKNVAIYLEVDEQDAESEAERIRGVLASMVPGELNVSVTLMSDLSGVSTFREQPNYDFFDYYVIKGLDYEKRIDRLE